MQEKDNETNTEEQIQQQQKLDFEQKAPSMNTQASTTISNRENKGAGLKNLSSMSLNKKQRASLSMAPQSSKSEVGKQQNESRGTQRAASNSQKPPAAKCSSKGSNSQEQQEKEPIIDVLTVPVIDKNPQQNTFEFNDVGLTISSAFDSGNLAWCKQSEDDPLKFTMTPSGDGLPYTNSGHYRTWFYFSVKGITSGSTISFTMKHLAHQGKLHKAGLKPVFRILPINKRWRRCGGTVTWAYLSDGFALTWTHYFPQFQENQTVYFAWTYPYSFEESLKHTQKMMTKFQNHDSIYMHREVLYYSREHRPMEMITFSGKQGITEDREDLLEGLFPEHSLEDEKNMRPFKFDKPTIFLSCRVHPGETPASFVLDGIWSIIANEKSEWGKVLREKFVFKIVPQLNPDGVYRGFFRLDTLGQNLNRYYLNPKSDKQPTIWAVKCAIDQQHSYKKLVLYVDLHAHASKRGCFMFGNNLMGEAMLQNMLLPKLISLNSLNFDFMECSFSDKLMGCKDKKDGLTREGCGRVSIMKATELPNCYTLECNYASGKRVNHISAKLNSLTGQQESEIPITDVKSKFYTENQYGFSANGSQNTIKQSPPYTIEVFEDIGRAFCVGVLDFFECNPISRLPLSVYKNVQGVKNDILSHNPIFIPKKKEEEVKKQVIQQQKTVPPIRTNNMNGSRQYAKSLQRVQTQRQTLSGAPTGETSTVSTGVASAFANKLSQKLPLSNQPKMMVKGASENANVKAENAKSASVRSSKVMQPTGPQVNQPKALSQQQKHQQTVHQQMLHQQFQRQLKVNRPMPKNPNTNHNSGGARSYHGTKTLTHSQKNFLQMNRFAQLQQLEAQTRKDDAELQNLYNQRNHIEVQDHTDPGIGCSDSSSACSGTGEIYEEEQQIDEILNKRQHYRQDSASSAGLPSLGQSSSRSNPKLSNNSDGNNGSKNGHKRRATELVKQNSMMSPSNQNQPSIMTNANRQSIKNANQQKQQQFSKSNADRKRVRQMLDNVQAELKTDDEVRQAKTRVNSKASHKRKKNHQSSKLRGKQNQDYTADEEDPNGQKNVERRKRKKVKNDDIASKSESRLSSPMSNDEHREKYKTGDDDVNQSFFPSAQNYQQKLQKMRQTPTSSLASASEYGKGTRSKFPKAVSTYNQHSSSKSKKKTEFSSFDRGNSDLVKSIVNSQQVGLQQIENQIISTEGSFAGAIHNRNSFIAQNQIDPSHPNHRTVSLNGEIDSRGQQFSIANRLNLRPKNLRGNSIEKNPDREQQIMDHDLVLLQQDSQSGNRTGITGMVDSQKRKRTSESQKHHAINTKTGSANQKYTRMLQKKMTEEQQNDNFSALNIGQSEDTEAGTSVPSQQMHNQQHKKAMGHRLKKQKNNDADLRAHAPFTYFRMPTPPQPEKKQGQPLAMTKLTNPSTTALGIDAIARMNSGSTPISHHCKPQNKHMFNDEQTMISALHQQHMYLIEKDQSHTTPNQHAETLLPLIPRHSHPLAQVQQKTKKRVHQNSVPPTHQISLNSNVPPPSQLFLSNSLHHLNAESNQDQQIRSQALNALNMQQHFGSHKSSAANPIRGPAPKQSKSPGRHGESVHYDTNLEQLTDNAVTQQLQLGADPQPFPMNTRQLHPAAVRNAKHRSGGSVNPSSTDARVKAKAETYQQYQLANDVSLTKFQMAEQQYLQASLRQQSQIPLGSKVYHVNGNPYVQQLAEQARQKQGLPSKL